MVKIFCSLFICLLTLFACKPLTGPFPANQEWKLAELDGRTVPPNVRATIRFDATQSRYSGHNACNSYSGAYELDGLNLKLGPAMSTKKFCADVSEWEANFMNMLTTVDNYAFQKGTFRLQSGGKVVAVFH